MKDNSLFRAEKMAEYFSVIVSKNFFLGHVKSVNTRARNRVNKFLRLRKCKMYRTRYRVTKFVLILLKLQAINFSRKNLPLIHLHRL